MLYYIHKVRKNLNTRKEYYMYNFNEVPESSVQGKARDLLRTDLFELLKSHYDVDENEDTVITQVGNNEISVCLGLRTVGEEEMEVCVNILLKAKPFKDKIVESSGKPVKAYERIKEGELYEDEVKIANEKAKKKAEEKAERDRKLKELKEQKQREKEEKIKQNQLDNG